MKLEFGDGCDGEAQANMFQGITGYVVKVGDVDYWVNAVSDTGLEVYLWVDGVEAGKEAKGPLTNITWEVLEEETIHVY